MNIKFISTVPSLTIGSLSWSSVGASVTVDTATLKAYERVNLEKAYAVGNLISDPVLLNNSISATEDNVSPTALGGDVRAAMSGGNVVLSAPGIPSIQTGGSTTVVDNLTSTSATSALSANQGKILNDSKQATLVSGSNIKTINGQSLLGAGDLAISGGGGGGSYGGFVSASASTSAISSWHTKTALVTAASTITLSASTLPNEWECSFLTNGAFQVTFATADTAVIRNAYGHVKSSGTAYEVCTIVRISSTEFLLYGATAL